MIQLPVFPEKIPIALQLRDAIHTRLTVLDDGISEFSFANLYLFRKKYQYCAATIGSTLVIHGIQDGIPFLMFPEGIPDDRLPQLLRAVPRVRCISQSTADAIRMTVEQMGFTLEEDRNNFDYLYLRKDLEKLEGKKYHKKRNLINSFTSNYEYTEEPIDEANLHLAQKILDEWRTQQTTERDYTACSEALQNMAHLKLCGYIVRVAGEPAGFTIGESLARGGMFVVHFEKAINQYKGIYQFMNRAFAAILPRHYIYINREQDLGDEGLRQAKMTYRPSMLLKKYVLTSCKNIA